MPDRLDELHRALGRMEGKLDSIKDTLEQGRVKFRDHDERIDTLERHRDTMTGGTAVVRYLAHAVSGAIGAVIAWLFGGGHLPRL